MRFRAGGAGTSEEKHLSLYHNHQSVRYWKWLTWIRLIQIRYYCRGKAECKTNRTHISSLTQVASREKLVGGEQDGRAGERSKATWRPEIKEGGSKAVWRSVAEVAQKWEQRPTKEGGSRAVFGSTAELAQSGHTDQTRRRQQYHSGHCGFDKKSWAEQRWKLESLTATQKRGATLVMHYIPRRLNSKNYLRIQGQEW